VVFIDANIFIYHLTGRSQACRVLLERCEVGEVRGITGVHVLLEVLHRLMMLEAVQRGLVSPGNVARKLKERPEVVKALGEYARHVGPIPHMGISVLPVDSGLVWASREVRRQAGLLVYDSISVAMMDGHGIKAIATEDQDFLRVAGLQVYAAADV
jgi:predicted nucleic acid-binding protein